MEVSTGSKSNNREGEQAMNRRKELQLQYKETKTEAGIVRITNKKNGKVFLVGSRNVKNINGIEFQLGMGSHMNRELQKDWKEFGKDAFEIDVAEYVKIPESGYFDLDDHVKKLEDKWLEQLQPYDDRGYNKRKP
jgi:hypothetical protein